MSKEFKFLDCAAVELEGRWDNPKLEIHPDASLKTDKFSSSKYIGEIVSKPLENEELLFKFIKDNWPDEKPDCCGFHIHVSFKHINYYAKLMEPEFYNGFLSAMRTWGENYPCTNDLFWSRLDGDHRFCKNDFRAERQVKCITKDQARADDLRCTQLNYCFGLYKTLENRMFPMFSNPNTAISAAKAYLDYIEDYLDKNPVSNDEILMEIVDDDAFYEIKENGEFVTKVQNNIQLKRFDLYKRNSFIRMGGQILSNLDNYILYTKSNDDSVD